MHFMVADPRVYLVGRNRNFLLYRTIVDDEKGSILRPTIHPSSAV